MLTPNQAQHNKTIYSTDDEWSDHENYYLTPDEQDLYPENCTYYDPQERIGQEQYPSASSLAIKSRKQTPWKINESSRPICILAPIKQNGSHT